THLNDAGEHDFVFRTPDGQPLDWIFLDKGFWEEFRNSPERTIQARRDSVSYLWDSLIERFAQQPLQSPQNFVTEGGFQDSEKILRFMAGEPRLVRRAHSEGLLDMLTKAGPNTRGLRVLLPLIPGHPLYVVVLLPVPPERPYAEYREVRLKYLYACCQVAKLKFPDA